MHRRNGILIGIIILICVICFVAARTNLVYAGRFLYLLLGGALFLLYYTKQKNWALWGGMLFAGIWCWNFVNGLFGSAAIIAGLFLFLLPGIILLRKYRYTGWEGYVVPGCFLFWGGCYVLMSNTQMFARRPCTTLLICLLMVFYTAYGIRKRNCAMTTVFARGLLIFLIINIIAGFF